jgi:L-threonylcarbamoyladenylate synthase
VTQHISNWRFKMVAARLRQGEVIAYPTEGVWGLGCVPEDLQAVNRILALKNRSWQQGLILVASSIEQCQPYIGNITPEQRHQLTTTWPGPVTFLVPRGAAVPDWIAGESDKVALRVSAHPVIVGLCEQLGQPMVSTSANPTGKAAALSALKVQQYFHGNVDYVLPGRLGVPGAASEIRDLASGEVIRPAPGSSSK